MIAHFAKPDHGVGLRIWRVEWAVCLPVVPSVVGALADGGLVFDVWVRQERAILETRTPPRGIKLEHSRSHKLWFGRLSSLLRSKTCKEVLIGRCASALAPIFFPGIHYGSTCVT